MKTIAAPARPRQPHDARTGDSHLRETLADACVPIAAQLVATVRDYGPDEVARVLALVPDGRYDALAVVLAAMVDPDANAAQLLHWTTTGPVKSRPYTPPHLQVQNIPSDAWGRRTELRKEVARLTNAGLSAKEISVRLRITTRSVSRHRAAVRAAADAADQAAETAEQAA